MTDQHYTVALLRSQIFEELSDAPAFGKDTYFALVHAKSIDEAISKARKEVFDADITEQGCIMRAYGIGPDDYILIAVFDGHQVPLWYGCQEKT